MSHRPALLLCLFALWLQMLAPALALGMRMRVAAPTSAICHSDSSGHRDGERGAPHSPPCDHCLSCDATADALPIAGRPAFVVFDYPIVSALRWTMSIRGPTPVELRRTSRPRGPPIPF